MLEPGLVKDETSVPLGDAASMLVRLCAQFAARCRVRQQVGRATFEGRFGRADLTVGDGCLLICAQARDPTGLSIVKMTLADQIAALAGPAAPVFAWNDSHSDLARLPYFHELTVARMETVTPRMRRVVVTGDVAPLMSGGLHVRVLIPRPGIAPVWPMLAPDGRIRWPSGETELTPRVYTLRNVDLECGEAWIDVVLHEGASTPGSDWARDAVLGRRVGLLGPGGEGPGQADRLLLVGDETALPAIARILGSLPATAHATVRIEVADRAEEQPLSSQASLDLAWCHRDGAAAGTTTLLEAAVRAADWRGEGGSTAVWGGCEQAAARALRQHLIKDCGLAKSDCRIAAYWRRDSDGAEP